MWFYLLPCVFGFLSIILVWAKLPIKKTKPSHLKSLVGPAGLPLLGNILQVTSTPHKKFMEWGKQYGKVFLVKFGSNKIVVISDPYVAKSAFNSASLAGRPTTSTIRAYQDGGTWGIALSEGKPWEEQRRFTIKHLKDLGLGKNSTESLTQKGVNDFLELLEKNKCTKDIERKLQWLVVHSIWTLVHGEEVKGNHDQDDLKIVDYFMTFANETNKMAETGAMLAPWLKYFILPTFLKFKKYSTLCSDFVTNIIDEHRDPNSKNNFYNNYIDAAIDVIKNTEDKQSSFYQDVGYRNLKGAIKDLFLGGTTTTSATITWGILYLVKNINVQRKLQEEIDRVIGHNRHPMLIDRPSMPYTEAVIKEILRASSHVPIGIWHKAIWDTEIDGFFIPKDSMVVANLYGFHYDRSVWGDPENFRPERFLDNEDAQRKKDYFFPFSVGKRQCLGESVARDSIFLFLTSTFQKFSIEEDPNDPIEIRAKPGVSLNPMPFIANVNLRSQGR